MAQTFDRYKNMMVEVASLKVAGTDVTASILEVSAIDGLTASAAELNLNDGAVAGTSVASKTLALGADKNTDVLALPVSGLKIGAGAGTAVTSSAAELNILTGVTASAAEINLIDGSIAGTSVASKALSLGADKNTDVLALPVSGLKIGAGAGTAVTASAAELNILTGVTKTAAEVNLLAAGVAGGYKVARVSMALDGGNPTSWATGLATIISASVQLVGSAAPGVGTSILTCLINGTSLDVYAWKVTSTIDNTLVASTGTEVFYGIAIGT